MTDLTKEQREAIEWAAWQLKPVIGDEAQGHRDALLSILAAHPTEQCMSEAEDAARYRWLRRRAVMIDTSDDAVIVLTLFKNEGPTGEFLDDQVDDARKAEIERAGGKA